jgi:dTDP-glucose 4,6-dehydratase
MSLPPSGSIGCGEVFLVTGGCGFIGSHFVNHIVRMRPGATVVNLDVEAVFLHEDILPEDVRTSERYHFHQGNVNNYDLLVNLMRTYRFTHIVHFAAHSHVDTSFQCSGKRVLEYTSDNVGGTHVLLEATRQALKGQQPLFLHFSTDEVYGDDGHESCSSERDRLAPTNPYAASKACAEMYVQAYTRSYGLRTVVTRCNNVFGPGQHPEKLIPKFLQRVRRGEACPVHGQGESRRNFIYVSDVVDAVVFLLLRPQAALEGQVFNIAGPCANERTVLEVVAALGRLVGKVPRVKHVEDRPYNDQRYFISGSKLTGLGWAARVGFEEGLAAACSGPTY